MKSGKIMIILLPAALLTALPISVPPVSAQEFPFFTGEAPGYVSEFEIEDFAIADLDGNGTGDVITSEPDGDCLKTFFAVESEFFSPPAAIPVNHPTWITTGDFNGDGIPEIAVCQPLRNRVAVLTRQPGGSYDVSAAYPMAGEFNDILADHFNADEHLDLAVLINHQSLRILLNQGDGTFNNPGSGFSCACQPGELYCCDLNGDGATDLAGWNYRRIPDPWGSPYDYYVHELFVKKNNGFGGFPEYLTTSISEGDGTPQSFCMGIRDLDGDTDADVLLSYSGGLLGVHAIMFVNDGAGNFVENRTVYSGALQFDHSFVILDIDHDSDSDILMGPGLAVLINDGNGEFRRFEPQSRLIMRDMIAPDLNGDGFADIIGRTGSNTVAVLFHDSVSNFSTGCSYTGLQDSRYIVLEDFNLDGIDDMLVGRSTDGYWSHDIDSLFVFLNDGSGHPGTKTWERAAFFGDCFFCIDIDSDGDTDILFSENSAERRQIMLAENNGAGEFSVSSIITDQISYMWGICSLDFDSDERPDLVVAGGDGPSGGPGFFRIYRQNETGGFENVLQRILAYPVYMQNIIATNVNGDAMIDVVVGTDEKLFCYLNNPEDPFTDVIQYTLPHDSSGLESADLNNDGVADFASRSDDSTSILLNDGTGNFTVTADIPAGSYPRSLLFHDWNRDGSPDLAIGVCSGVSICMNEGSGSFVPTYPFFGTFGTPTSLAVSDMDGDGDDDIVAGCEALTFLFNTEFSPPPDPGLDLFITDSSYSSYELFSIGAVCRGGPQVHNADLYALLDVHGMYYFWPGWTADAAGQPVWLGDTPRHITLLQFELPDFEPSPALIGLRFWGALTEPGTVNLIGDVDSVTFDLIGG